MRALIAAGFWGVVLAAGSAFAAEEGLVGHWNFDKAGPRVADLSGRGHDVALAGGKFVGEGGNALLRLDGKQRITVASHADLHLQKGFSIEARIRPTDLRDGRYIVSKHQEYLIRADWPVEGTTGYEFANDVTALFVDPAGEEPLTELYAELTGERRPFAEVAHEAKLEVARTTFAQEFDRLRALLPQDGLEEAAAELHVYRTYVEPERVDEDCFFHLRLSKQDAFLGDVRITYAEDAISIRAKIAAYPARYDLALEQAREYFHAK